ERARHRTSTAGPAHQAGPRHAGRRGDLRARRRNRDRPLLHGPPRDRAHLPRCRRGRRQARRLLGDRDRARRLGSGGRVGAEGPARPRLRGPVPRGRWHRSNGRRPAVTARLRRRRARPHGHDRRRRRLARARAAVARGHRGGAHLRADRRPSRPGQRRGRRGRSRQTGNGSTRGPV
ncbi:MAG: hypothetical protein AVDCRST_MAG85-4183, partial [uncultured Solirubrobacteraceae bacterium]